MTPTSAGPQLDIPSFENAGRWNPRLVAVLLALIFPTQLLPAVGILGATSTASVAQTFHTTQVAWFGLTFVLVSTLLTPFVIKLGDRYGKKRVMLAMTALGTIGDVIAALAGSFAMLLVGRAIAGCYGPFAALSFPVVRDVFPRQLVKPASGILGSSVGIVAVASPFLAGWLVDNWGYRGAMWFLAAAMAFSFGLVAVVVPKTPRHDFKPGFDWLGGLVLGGGLTAVIYATGRAQEWGLASPQTLGWIGGGMAALVVFLFVERASAHPILDLRVLSRRPVALVLTAGGFAQAIAFTLPGMAILLALFPSIPGVSAGLGWSAQHNAVVGVSWNLVMFAAGMVASRLLRTWDTRLIWWPGLVLLGAGYGALGFLHSDEIEMMVTLSLAHLGAGLVVAGAPALVVGVVTKQEQGLGSGMLNMLTSLFGAVITAGFFAILSANGTIVDGTTFYLDPGYSWVFWTGAMLTAGILVISAFIPVQREVSDDAAILR